MNGGFFWDTLYFQFQLERKCIMYLSGHLYMFCTAQEKAIKAWYDICFSPVILSATRTNTREHFNTSHPSLWQPWQFSSNSLMLVLKIQDGKGGYATSCGNGASEMLEINYNLHTVICHTDMFIHVSFSRRWYTLFSFDFVIVSSQSSSSRSLSKHSPPIDWHHVVKNLAPFFHYVTRPTPGSKNPPWA
jgi:hypothetical protein